MSVMHQRRRNQSGGDGSVSGIPSGLSLYDSGTAQRDRVWLRMPTMNWREKNTRGRGVNDQGERARQGKARQCELAVI